MLKRSLIIPAAGSATRMRGLPKFLLPTLIENTTLIERHINFLSKYFDETLIAVNPDFSKLINSVLDKNVQQKILDMSTQSMMETVWNLCQTSKSDSFLMIMPDTYFSDYSEILNFLREGNSIIPNLLCWEMKDYQKGNLGQVLLNEDSFVVDIKDKDPHCEYLDFWGVASFRKEDLEVTDKADAHLGFMYERLLERGIKVQGTKVTGSYYDCGTQSEYLRMLKENEE